jgi:hypothetical protein
LAMMMEWDENWRDRLTGRKRSKRQDSRPTWSESKLLNVDFHINGHKLTPVSR